MPCSKCNKDYPIVNKKYNLCGFCNHERLHGKTVQETAQEQGAKYLLNYAKKQNGKEPKIKQQTSKEASVKSKLGQLKKEIELEAVQNNEYYCWGCGTSYVGLDKSHILPIGDRKDLELDKDNIDLLCRDCHNKWESQDADNFLELLCLEKDIIYIRKKDPARYNQILTKINDWLRNYLAFSVDEEKSEKYFTAFRITQTYEYIEF